MYLQKIKHKVDPSKGFEYPLTVFHFAYPSSSVFVARLSMYWGPSVRMSHKTSQKRTFPFSVGYKTPKEENHLLLMLLKEYWILTNISKTWIGHYYSGCAFCFNYNCVLVPWLKTVLMTYVSLRIITDMLDPSWMKQMIFKLTWPISRYWKWMTKIVLWLFQFGCIWSGSILAY